MRMECKLFVRYSVDKKGWGGPETIQAVSSLYKVNVYIFNEDETCYISQNTNRMIYEKTVAIAYRFGRNHYDSVCDMNADDMYTAAQHTMDRINRFK